MLCKRTRECHFTVRKKARHHSYVCVRFLCVCCECTAWGRQRGAKCGILWERVTECRARTVTVLVLFKPPKHHHSSTTPSRGQVSLYVWQSALLVKGISANMHISACPTLFRRSVNMPRCVSWSGPTRFSFFFFFLKGMNGYLSDLCSSKDTCQWRCIHSNCVKYYKLKCLL